mgnify:FL=1|tara:strand:- start:224 stop:604 length:381 start_codon:yes stop_codon:yes gene_type:complete
MITALYAGILGIMYVILSVQVIKGRFHYRISLFDGNNDDMKKRIRAHANFAEYVPLALVLMICMELQRADDIYLHLLGITLCAGRFAHAIGIVRYLNANLYRALGTVATFTVITIASIYLILEYFY